MSPSPVKSTAALTATGDPVTSPCYLRGVYFVSGAGAGGLTLTNGSGGATVFDIDTPAAVGATYMELPGRGIRCESGLTVSGITGVTSATLFYEG